VLPTTLDTAALAAAAAACGQAGGCELLVANGTFLTGPLWLPGRSTVRIDPSATLLAAPMAMWEAAGCRAGALLNGDGLANVTITGGN
jgi:polygalacturonase